MTDLPEVHIKAQRAESQPPLDISALATVEVTSADDLFPIEQAFQPEPANGWRAASPGAQTIRLLFHAPQRIAAVRLHFVERAAERRQIIILRLGTRSAPGQREIFRREFSFSPSGLTDEIEEIALPAEDVASLELTIDPDTHAGARHDAYATLASMQLLSAPSGTERT